MTDTIKTPTSFWVISVLALLWNLMGLAAFFMEYGYYTNPDSRSSLPEAMQPMYDAQPYWLYIIFALAVFGGVIGCIGLLLKKSWCDPMFLISLIAVIILHGFNLFFAEYNFVEELGASSLVMPILVVVIAAYLLFFAKKHKASGLIM